MSLKEHETASVQQFASDNYAGVCPEVMAAFERANATGHVAAYGEDHWTQNVCDSMRELFETDCEVYFVFNGTAANSLALASMCQSYHAVICQEMAHVETDECGAPAFFSNGSRLLLAKGPDGKLTPEAIEETVVRRTDIHYPKPKVVTVTQATEVGTVYNVEELQAVSRMAKKYNMGVHMDGARFSNAVASFGVHPADISWRAGVDVLCFGGTKNGLPVGEAVIFFNKDYAADFAYRAKQAGQLCSKMRFISAPWLGLLKKDIWLRNARHANQMAQLLEEKLAAIDAVDIVYPRQSNAVFVELPDVVAKTLREAGWKFYSFIGGSSRLMCSWDTTSSTIDRFVLDLHNACKGL